MMREEGEQGSKWWIFARTKPASIFRAQSSRTRFALGVVVLFCGILLFHVVEDRVLLDRPPYERGFTFSLMRTLPLKSYSKIVGGIGCTRFPYPLNLGLVLSMKYLLGIDLSDASERDVRKYRSMNEIFTRRLAPNSRRIGRSRITSPVDGQILCMGRARERTGKIKGIDYNLEEFLGVKSVRELLDNPGNDLYQIVIYLSPENYHRFHSFTEASIREIKHIPGVLISVGKWPMRYIRGLLQMNERVVFLGRCTSGFAAFVAVGSTGVGSIETPFAPLVTNEYFSDGAMKIYETDVYVKKGEELGHFNLGSTVALFFEGPRDVRFKKVPRDRVKLGQSLADFP